MFVWKTLIATLSSLIALGLLYLYGRKSGQAAAQLASAKETIRAQQTLTVALREDAKKEAIETIKSEKKIAAIHERVDAAQTAPIGLEDAKAMLQEIQIAWDESKSSR